MTPRNQPKSNDPRAHWNAGRSVDIDAVAKLIMKDAFQADPDLGAVRFDFVDCEGVPIIWLDPVEKDDGGEERDSAILSDYDPPDGFPYEEIEAVSYDLLREYGKQCEMSYRREDVLGEANP